jgi:deoxyuridine 5'-triphosphate nucleotidohydrolase
MDKIIIAPVWAGNVPGRAHETDAWFDVFSSCSALIQPKSMVNVPVWVKVAMPNWMVCLLLPRSSLFAKKWLLLVNSVWVVDAWYRGEIGMQLYNTTDKDVVIEDWEKIGQLIFTNYSTDVEISVDYENFEEKYPSDRGANWFGSTWN